MAAKVLYHKCIVNFREAGTSDWSTIPVTPPGSTQVTINRLAPGTMYEFQVSGKNALGDGMTSKIVSVRTLGTHEKYIWNDSRTFLPLFQHAVSEADVGLPAHKVQQASPTPESNLRDDAGKSCRGERTPKWNSLPAHNYEIKISFAGLLYFWCVHARMNFACLSYRSGFIWVMVACCSEYTWLYIMLCGTVFPRIGHPCQRPFYVA